MLPNASLLCRPRIDRRFVLRIVLLGLVLACRGIAAQQPSITAVGVLTPGGKSYAAAVAGLLDSLREAGFEDGRNVALDVRVVRGDLRAAEAAARALEEQKVALICTFGTSTTLAAKKGTRNVPLAFYAGTDPVAVGLAVRYSKPGGRFTGVHGRATDLTAKRVQMLRDMVPRLRRVITFYNPDNESARRSLELARDAARQLDIQVVEKPIHSVDELRTALRALRPGEFDGVMHVSDAMVTSDADFVVQVAAKLKMATLFQDREVVHRGALASYGLSYYAIGRQLGKTVERILKGARPGDIAIDQVDRVEFVVNIKTAKALGLTIPQTVLNRADDIVQ